MPEIHLYGVTEASKFGVFFGSREVVDKLLKISPLHEPEMIDIYELTQCDRFHWYSKISVRPKFNTQRSKLSSFFRTWITSASYEYQIRSVVNMPKWNRSVDLMGRSSFAAVKQYKLRVSFSRINDILRVLIESNEVLPLRISLCNKHQRHKHDARIFALR